VGWQRFGFWGDLAGLLPDPAIARMLPDCPEGIILI